MLGVPRQKTTLVLMNSLDRIRREFYFSGAAAEPSISPTTVWPHERRPTSKLHVDQRQPRGGQTGRVVANQFLNSSQYRMQ